MTPDQARELRACVEAFDKLGAALLTHVQGITDLLIIGGRTVQRAREILDAAEKPGA